MRFLLALLALAFSLTSTAQPTWRFHLAFEDGTGARDTIWMVYDTTATLGSNPWPGPNVDTLLGEGFVNVNDGLFHVFRANAVGDTTQTNAFPYAQFPNFDGTIIDAINWTPPMTITWDTSLFHAPYLPYSQGSFGIAIMDGLAFSAYMNHPELGFGVHDMLINDSLTVSELTDYLFTFSVYFGEDDHVGIHGQHLGATSLGLWPNPATGTLHLKADGNLRHIRILDLSGRTLIDLAGPEIAGAVDIDRLSPGTYFVQARSTQNHLYHGSFQKIE